MRNSKRAHHLLDLVSTGFGEHPLSSNLIISSPRFHFTSSSASSQTLCSPPLIPSLARSSERTLASQPIPSLPHSLAFQLNCRHAVSSMPLSPSATSTLSSYLPNTLITMHAKDRNLANALNVFDKMPKRDKISCTPSSPNSKYSIKCPNETMMKSNFIKKIDKLARYSAH